MIGLLTAAIKSPSSIALGIVRSRYHRQARIAITAIIDRLTGMKMAANYRPAYVPAFATRGFQDLHFSFATD
jgi:hypothetical protein